MVCGSYIKFILFRVTNVRFSKRSDSAGGALTQPFEPTKSATGSFCWTHRRIRHPWLRSRSRQRPVAELLGMRRTLRKTNILHSHKINLIYEPHTNRQLWKAF